MITEWSGWYQPADVVVPSGYSSVWAGWARRLRGRVWNGATVAYLGSFGGLVNFPAECAALAAGVGFVGFGGGGAGMGDTTDYAKPGVHWVAGSNYPQYDVGYRGSAIGATPLFPAPSWNMQVESTVISMTTAGLYSYTALHALEDPSLPWNNTAAYPPGATAILGLEWEHTLYPEIGSGGYIFADDVPGSLTASSAFVSGNVVTTVDADDLDRTNQSWNLRTYVYPASAGGGDEAFIHTHGSNYSTLALSAGSPATTASTPIPATLPDFPVLPRYDTIDGFDFLEDLEAAGFPAITASFVHEGVAAGAWNYDIGDGSADAYNTQRALVEASLTAVMRPSRVRFLFQVYETPNLTGALGDSRRRFLWQDPQ